jgi:hypothetical protein
MTNTPIVSILNGGNESFISHEMGMTLRDYFAAKAMQSDISNATAKIEFEIGHWNLDAIAIRAYKMADAMIEAREL